MTQEELHQLLVDLAAVEELDGPPTGPWIGEVREGDSSLRKEIHYSEGYLTFRSVIDTETIDTTERYTPQNQRDAMMRWLEIKEIHLAELMGLVYELAKGTGLPN